MGRPRTTIGTVWKEEYSNNQARAEALIKAVEDTGIEPFEEPERYPKIDLDEVRLICWLAVEAA